MGVPFKTKYWCVTLNNYVADDVADFEGLECSYRILAREIGAEGTHHLQGYIEFVNRKSLLTVKRLLGSRWHLEIRRGTGYEASEYCKKDGEFTELGKIPCQHCGY